MPCWSSTGADAAAGSTAEAQAASRTALRHISSPPFERRAILELFERWGDSDEEPILLARSDNGPQMRAGTTREFLAMCSIAARFGRPGTPTDQAWIETLFGHVKTEWPHLEQITDPNTLRVELDNVRTDYNTRRLHASLG